MHIVFQDFLYDERKIGAFGAVAVVIIAIVFMFPDSVSEQFFSLCDLHPDLGEEGEFKGCTILIYQRLHIYVIEKQRIIIINIEAFLGKVECLMDKIGIRGIVHFLVTKGFCERKNRMNKCLQS